MMPGTSPRSSRKIHRIPVCLAILGVLIVWLWIWPFTGDGDSALHYENLREGAHYPERLLTSWARPLFAALMLVPALGGVVVARCFAAMVSTVLAWQTMRMADDLEMPAATLAGVLVLWQPLAFALASDTMTEIPLALGIVVAVRLWWARKYAWSSLIVSFLPMVRPEGFFLIVMWGLMALFGPGDSWSLRRRIRACLLLGVGLLSWTVACLLITRDALYVVHHWSWPLESYPAYNDRERPLLHHLLNWCHYCGPLLFVLFVLGVIPSLRRAMALPWAVWLLVLTVHSVLFWGGWFAALGLMRIMVCTAPMTALICLHGWNLAGRWCRRWQWPIAIRAGICTLAFIAGSITPVIYYDADARNYRCFPLLAAVDFIENQQLLQDAPRFFAGDKIVTAALDIPVDSQKICENLWNRERQRAMLAALPPGSIGVWDNQQAEMWFNLSIDEIEALGFRIIFEIRRTLPARCYAGFCLRGSEVHQRVVVIRKTSS